MKNLKRALGIFSALLMIDQLLKGFIVGKEILPVTANAGIIFGNMADADPILRTIFFSTFFILTLFVLVFIQVYFLRPQRYNPISLSLAVFGAGISGNAIDRIRLGYAIDYIQIPWSFFSQYAFNFADIVQLAGLFLTLLFLFRHNNDLWPDDNERQMNLVDKKYQIAFSVKLSLICFFSMLMMGTFSWSFFKVYLPAFDERLQGIFIASWMVISGLLLVCTFLFGIILSGRSVGPVYALERFVRELKQGKDAHLKLREMDSFKQLEVIARDIRELIGKK